LSANAAVWFATNVSTAALDKTLPEYAATKSIVPSK